MAADAVIDAAHAFAAVFFHHLRFIVAGIARICINTGWMASGAVAVGAAVIDREGMLEHRSQPGIGRVT